MSFVIFIALLIALIWVHELGHLFAAKAFKIRVSEFNIGFPPRLFSMQWGETRYSFSLLLVGGYVSIYGEDSQEGKGDPRSLASKNRFIQALVIVAGVAMNLVVGWLALSGAYLVGVQAAVGQETFGTVTAPHPVVVAVLPNSPAQKVGLQPGDTIETIQTAKVVLDARTLNTNQQSAVVTKFISDHQDESLVFTVTREHKEQNFVLRAEEGIVEGKKAVGIQMEDIGMLRLPLHLALAQGAIEAKDMTIRTAQGLGGFLGSVVQGVANWNTVAGPIGIAGVGAGAVRQGFSAAAVVLALISINLALINLLPIPGLDGGRLLIIIIEGIIRRPVPVQFVNYLTLAGFALVVALMIAVTYHDIARLVG